NQFEMSVGGGALQEFILAGGEIVPTHDRLAAAKQLIGKGAADKTGGASDKDPFQRGSVFGSGHAPACSHKRAGAGDGSKAGPVVQASVGQKERGRLARANLAKHRE